MPSGPLMPATTAEPTLPPMRKSRVETPSATPRTSSCTASPTTALRAGWPRPKAKVTRTMPTTSTGALVEPGAERRDQQRRREATTPGDGERAAGPTRVSSGPVTCGTSSATTALGTMARPTCHASQPSDEQHRGQRDEHREPRRGDGRGGDGAAHDGRVADHLDRQEAVGAAAYGRADGRHAEDEQGGADRARRRARPTATARAAPCRPRSGRRGSRRRRRAGRRCRRWTAPARAAARPARRGSAAPSRRASRTTPRRRRR